MLTRIILAALLSLFCIESADAAYAYIQGGQHQNGASSSTTVAITLTSPVAAGDAVMISVGWATVTVGDTITGIVDDKGDTLTLVDSSYTGAYKFQSAYLLNATAGAQVFTATISASRTFGAIVADEFSGVATSAALDGHAINLQSSPSGSNSVTSTTITPTTNGDLIYGSLVNVSGNGTQSAGTGFTQAQNTPSLFLSEYLTQATAASIAATATPSAGTDVWVTYVMAFKPGAGGGPVFHSRLLKGVGQ